MPNKNKTSFNVENFVFIIVALVSVTVGVLHTLGLLEYDFINHHIPSITLVVCGLICINLLIERHGVLMEMKTSLDSFNNSNQIAKILSIVERHAAFFESMDGNRFAELKMIYGIRNFSHSVTENRITCDKDQVFSMWNDVLKEASTFYAFNYVNPTEVWGTKGWAFNVAQAAQMAQIKQGCTIKRIFIIDTIEEMEELNHIIKLQIESGIEAKWILKKDLRNDKLFIDNLKEVGSYDFVVIDNDLLYTVYIDDDRRISGCSLVRSRDLNKKGLLLFTEAFHSGN